MFQTLCIALLSGFVFCSTAASAPKGASKSKAQLNIRPDSTVSPLHATLFGTNITPSDKKLMGNPVVLERVKGLGIKSCRFPNGCLADLYNWLEPKANEASVDEFLDFCDTIGAEAYYTINMQGGTEGLVGPPPEGAPLDEVIKYRHTAPNPCGYTNYHFGTLPETLELVKRYTVDRALAGKAPILHYEMGNENWGQATTDFPPEVYAATIEAYAKEMRQVLAEAKKQHEKLKDLELYIVAVGFPVMGNNMKDFDTPDRNINVRWTRELNKLYDAKIIDAVQEHFYPYGSANGGTLVWIAHNLHNIVHARKGTPNPRLKGYKDSEITYKMPLEFTEWNVKCWGPSFALNVQPVNPGFEDGLNGWTVTGGQVSVDPSAARRGSNGLKIRVSKASSPCEISQVFDSPEKAKIFLAGAWVRTDRADAVLLELRDATEGENKGKVLGGWKSTISNMWERVVASAHLPDGVKKLEVAVRVVKPANVFIDEVMLYNTPDERGHSQPSAQTFEQVLFCVDALRKMAVSESPRTHIHHLVGGYPCGQMTHTGEVKHLGRAYEFFTGRYGDRIVRSDLKTGTFKYRSAGNPWATDFNGLAPDLEKVPMLSAMTTRAGDTLHILLVNRTSDRDIEVDINLNADPADKTADVRLMTGPDIDLPGVDITESQIPVSRKFRQTVSPYSAQIISVKCK